MTFQEVARKVLSGSAKPISAREIWDEAVRLGLDKQLDSHGKTPWESLSAKLYVQSKKPGSDIQKTGSKPALFFIGDQKPCATDKTCSTDTSVSSVAEPPIPDDPAQAASFSSKFYLPCLEVLCGHAPSPLGVQQILNEALSRNPSLGWGRANGAVRAAMMRAVARGTPIRMVPNSKPPLFYVENGTEASQRPSRIPLQKTYSFIECAEKVLREFAERKPMHYQDITRKAIDMGWLKSDGESPANTMNSVIGTDIKKRQLFVKHGKGYVGLFEWVDPIKDEVDKHNRKVRQKLLSHIRSMNPKNFEILIQRLLEEMDFLDPKVTPYSNDHGIDVRGTWRIADGIQIKMAIQVKRQRENVQAPVVQAIRGALIGSERGMIITTSDFSKGAREEAEDQRKSSTISLVNGEQLVELLVGNGVGITRENVEILRLKEDEPLFS